MSDYLYLNEQNFYQEIEKESRPIFVDFWATWCGPCKMSEPIMNEVARVYENRAVYAKVNVDECPKLVRDFSIMSVPTVIFFDKGKMTAKEIGLKTKAVFFSHLDNLLRD